MSQTTTRLKSLADQLSFAVEDFTAHTDPFGREYVTFTTLHVSLDDDGVQRVPGCKVHSWRMTPDEALRYITGFADGVNYALLLDQTEKEREA